MTSSSQPTRRLHPAWIPLGALPGLRTAALPLIVLLLSGGEGRDVVVYGLALGLTLVGSVLRVAAWWRFRYGVVDDELRVSSGLLARRDRFVPLERIHAVDFSESLLQRLVGVVRVKVETAAGGASESDVVLEAVARSDAEALREQLLAARRPSEPAGDGDGHGVASPPPSEGSSAGPALIRSLSPTELLLAGATSGRVGPVLALVFGTFQLLDDVMPAWLRDQLSMSSGPSLRSVLVATALIGLGVWLLTIVSTVVTFGGFELRRDGDRLLISHGLLERRRGTIPLSRIQAVLVTEGVLRQPFGLAAVQVESAGYGRDAAESGVLFPLVPMSEIRTLLERACPAFALDSATTPLQRPPPRARRRYVAERLNGVLRLTVLAVVATALAPWTAWWWGLFALLLAPLAALQGLLCYRDAGWALHDAGRLTVRRRGIARVTTITTRPRLQRREVRQHLFQRRAGLATFRAAVASGRSGGRITVAHLEAAVAFDLLARLGPSRASLAPVSGPA